MPLGEDEIEKLFAKREEIDRALLEKHTLEMAVLFTDIVGSTQYFEQKGDIEGMRLLRRHNEQLFPIVERHRGRIIKTIGDAIMAVFPDPENTVRCAVEMHRALEADPVRPRIHIRAGAHFGRVFAAGNDVYGDTVNTAARVAHEARADEVLVSQALLERVKDGAALKGVPRGSLTLKGKAQPLPVVSIPWSDQLQITPMPQVAEAPRAAEELFVLDLQAAQAGLRVVALDGAADKGTVKAYAEVPFPREQLDELAHRFGTYMHQGGADSYVEQVRQQGGELFKKALSERARKHLQDTACHFLRLQLDDQLVHVPWELLHDGTEFVSLRFALGRQVSARADTSPVLRRPSDSSGPAVVISNASGGLPAADAEGAAVAGLLREGFSGGVQHLKGPLKRADFLAGAAGCALLHVAGHGEEAAGGFLCADGVVEPEALAVAVGRAAPPIVFANACHASGGKAFSEVARGVSNLASALLLRGTQHYIGPMWEMGDEDALSYALRFYEGALRGAPIGEAARAARQELVRQSRHPLSFAGYVLYGDPRTPFQGGIRRPAAVRSQSKDNLAAVPKPRKALTVPLLLVALAALAGGAWALSSLRANPAPAPVAAPVVAVTPKAVPHTGPLRICIFPFKSVGAGGQSLGDALQEALYTDFGQNDGVKLIERGQIELDVHEMDFESKYADPATRAALGRLTGAEVALVGGYQRQGSSLRVFARFIDVERGEVLHSFKVDGPESKAFELEEQVAAKARQAIQPLKGRLR